jgi:hypothetical protein
MGHTAQRWRERGLESFARTLGDNLEQALEESKLEIQAATTSDR